MKNIKTLLLIASLAAVGFTLLNCNPDETVWTDDGTNNTDSITSDSTIIKGSIKLPEGSVLQLKDLKVLTYGADNELESASFTAENSFVNQPLFVVDDQNNVKLMAYRYNGIDSIEVNATSTAVAMLMSLPATTQLNNTGKTALVKQVMADNDFKAIVLDYEEQIKQGSNLLDTQNTALAVKLQSYFTTLAKKRKGGTAPVKIYKSSTNQLTVQNPGKSYATFIGIYKGDNESPEEFLIQERINFYASSIKDLIDIGTSDFLPETQEQTYSLPTSGDSYHFKARNGMAGDGSFEDVGAFVYNVADYCYDVYSNVIPKSKEKKECSKAIRDALKAHIEKTVDVSMTGKLSVGIVYDYLESFVKDKENDLDCLYPDMKDGYKKVIKKYLGFTAWVSRIGTSGNILFGVYQLAQDKSSVDTCFSLIDGKIETCMPEFDLQGSWHIQFYTMRSNAKVEYLHQEEKFTLDENGEASTRQVRYPDNPAPVNEWKTQDGPVNIKFENGELIIDDYWDVDVADVDDQIFYSENWNYNYEIGDYYWKIKLMRL
ncbi:MAG: hypothetical protein ACPGLV_12155 [Bacteroidia bacterium]